MNLKILKVNTIILIILISNIISCVSYRGVHLINLTTRELPSETELILTTTKPVKYKNTKLESPPRLIISFPENNVYSIEEEVVMINKGPIKKIRNEYYQKGTKYKRQLNSVTVELIQDLPYEISNIGSSIIIRIENPKQPPNITHKEKTKIEAQAQIGDESSQIEQGYLVGPGDVLSIEVWKQHDISRDVVVNSRGEINLPPIKRIKVSGLTFSQIEDKITKALSKYIIDPMVVVKIKEYHSQKITVLGEINWGTFGVQREFILKKRTTLLELISEVGGPSANADISHIKLIKKDGRVFTFDLNELINDPQKCNKIIVSGGDTIYVPPLEINKVYVLGEVKTPKVIYIKRKLTLVDAVTEAGGYTHNAVIKSIIIIRGELGSQKGIRV
ncbi:MAG: polysaccharide biosynthesis/export family protein, partial [Candidatus Aminicenantia bacterium]